MYGPSFGSSVEFGASNEPGGGKAEAVGKFDEGMPELEGVTNVVALDEKVLDVYAVSIDGCEP